VDGLALLSLGLPAPVLLYRASAGAFDQRCAVGLRDVETLLRSSLSSGASSATRPALALSASHSKTSLRA
jgi:hypothetical protein